MKLTDNKLKQLIKEVLEEASEEAPFGPFTGSRPYVKSQRASKLSADKTRKLAKLDQDNPEMSRTLDQAFGIDSADPDIKTPVNVIKQQLVYSDIVKNQSNNYFSESGAEPTVKVKTAVGDAYKIGTWNFGKMSGSVFANKTGIYVLDDGGLESYYTPKGPHPSGRGNRLVPIRKDFSDAIFMG